MSTAMVRAGVGAVSAVSTSASSIATSSGGFGVVISGNLGTAAIGITPVGLVCIGIGLTGLLAYGIYKSMSQPNYVS